MVNTLVADKATADSKTQAANQAATIAAQATAASNQAQLDEAAADTQVTTDLTTLKNFIDSLS
jgi:hypothetical protein